MNIQASLRDRANNFTLMRLLASVAVLYGHAYDLALGRGGIDPVTQGLLYPWLGQSLPGLAVELFFVTSGFLIAASYVNGAGLFAFVWARVLRIYPALIVAVLLCVWVLGPMVTTLPIDQYLASGSTWAYLYKNATIVTGMAFVLPGVFEHLPVASAVNGSLWTLQMELNMYAVVAVVGLLGVLKRPWLFNVLFVAAFAWFTWRFTQHQATGVSVENLNLAFKFLLGTFFYLNRHRVSLGLGMLVFMAGLSYLCRDSLVAYHAQSALFAYVVLFMALHPRLRLPSLDHRGDLSYGVYIYAFPVQQLVIHLQPGATPMTVLGISLPVTLVLAALSWRWIERPMLGLKGWLRQPEAVGRVLPEAGVKK